MDEEKRISGKKNIILCIVSIVIFCILLFPLYYFIKDRAGNISESADFLSAYCEFKVLCGAGGDRRF